MTGFLGADTEALRQLGGTVTGGAEQLEDLAHRLGALIQSVTWEGPDAEVFRADWAGRVHPRLRERTERLREDSRELDGHAGEQDESSAPETRGGGGPSGAAPLPVVPSVLDVHDVPSAAGASDAVGDPRPLTAADLQLVSAATPLEGGAAEASDAVGAEGELAYPETGLRLSPPETDATITVDGDHELAPGDAEQPFGVDSEGEPLALAPDTAYEVGDHGTYYTDGDGAVTYIEATGGGEEMNPNLREVFPDATYHVNESTYYQTDELGRTEHMYVPDVIVDREMSRSQSIQSKIAERWDMAGDGTSEPVEFNAGHVLARQLGGIREEINYTRQWDAVNQARSGEDTIYTFESMMADGITDDGHSYSYETRVTWGDEQPDGVGPEQGSAPWEYVPESYDVRIHENGEQIVDEHLSNYPEGARFPG